MKKLQFLFVTLFLGGILLTGCDTCVTCGSCPQGVNLEETEICRSNYNSDSDYNSAVETVEAFGCSCQ